MTDDDQIQPPTLTTDRQTRTCLRVSALITLTHTHTHRVMFGLPEMHVVAHQRTLIAGSESEQIDVHQSVHETSLLGGLCALFLPTRMRVWALIRTHTHAHVVSPVSPSVTQTSLQFASCIIERADVRPSQTGSRLCSRSPPPPHRQTSPAAPLRWSSTL